MAVMSGSFDKAGTRSMGFSVLVEHPSEASMLSRSPSTLLFSKSWSWLIFAIALELQVSATTLSSRGDANFFSPQHEVHYLR